MGKPQPNARKLVKFHCPKVDCRAVFSTEPGRIEPDDTQDHHPWRYFAKCPTCGTESEQIYWERALLKAWAKATGPRTAAGIEAVTQNLEGHPTLEEAQRTRFNPMKHGIYAKVAKYFPARPGKYEACKTCEYLNNGCTVLTKACMKRAEVFMLYQLAYDEKNPRLLREMNMETQAALRSIVNDIILSITQRGVESETPQWYYDKDGGFHLASYKDDKTGEQVLLTEVKEHPLLKTLIDLLKANGMTLPDDGMTMKTAEEDQALQGYLADRKDAKEQLLEYQGRQTKALEGLEALILRSQDRVRRDPVLIEHQSSEDAADAGAKR